MWLFESVKNHISAWGFWMNMWNSYTVLLLQAVFRRLANRLSIVFSLSLLLVECKQHCSHVSIKMHCAGHWSWQAQAWPIIYLLLGSILPYVKWDNKNNIFLTECGRQNNDLPKKCPCNNPKNLWLCHLIWQRELYKSE